MDEIELEWNELAVSIKNDSLSEFKSSVLGKLTPQN
jgi:hypothetical protein